MLLKAQKNMIFGQILPNKINHSGLLHALEEINRENFVPEKYRSLAFADAMLPLTPTRHLISPLSFARLVQKAKIFPMSTILVVGAETGYSALLLSYLAKKVIALESDENLYALLVQNIEHYNSNTVYPVLGDLTKGAPDKAPYDAVIIPGAIDSISENLLQQTKLGGSLYYFQNTISGHLQIAVEQRVNRTQSLNSSLRTHIQHLFEAPAPLLLEFTNQPKFCF